ncbi:MAG: hypothetical protein OdinLCB4_006865 [Candidatus Odinarchaeum yellowstonii]|uniref:Uncharacterized protein n=1 Tax=Odinarchaeota yellowstonii (strain LCB_4) TaxID=1841599 RepID=A0AAF0D1X0_ODILC|nr:MAG: hypothetical protein OdinLCB4_006865 [Candidatus Odinarchaeum yellowstonii]
MSGESNKTSSKGSTRYIKAAMSYAKFIKEKYTYIIISALIVGLIIGVFTPSPGLVLRQFNTPLIIIMIGAMGFTITFKNLGEAVKDIKGFTLGMALNFLFAPFLCWILAQIFLPSYPELATGLILIGTVPCAGMALVWAGLLKGNVPLATVINAATMIAAPFLIPFFMTLYAGAFITINTWEIFQQLIYTILLPVIGGVILRELLERKFNVSQYLPLMPAISATVAVLLMFMAINTNIKPIISNIPLITLLIASTILVFPILFITSYTISIKLFTNDKNIAITYSAGMKNLPIAIGIAAMSFTQLTMLPIAIGFAFQMLTAVSFYQIFRRVMLQRESEKESPEKQFSEVGKITSGIGAA